MRVPLNGIFGLLKPKAATVPSAVAKNVAQIPMKKLFLYVFPRMNFDQIIPIIYMIGVLILVLPSFLQSNSKLKQFLSNLSIWVIIVLIVTTISYFLFK